MQACRNCHPRVVVTPLADGNGWLWHVVPGHPSTQNWGEAESREEALRAGNDYIEVAK